MSHRPAPLSPLSLGLALVTALGMGVVLLTGGTSSLLSPGELRAADESGEVRGGVAAHRELSARCSACHAPPLSGETMSRRCLACHDDTRNEQSTGEGLHGALGDGTGCLACHTEHGGARATLTPLDPRSFPHERYGFSLSRHVTTAQGTAFTCASCHTGEGDRWQDDGCRGCHGEADPAFMEQHVDEWGSACLECHDGTGSAGVDHTALGFPLEAGHGGLECGDCHGEARTRAAFDEADGSCWSCHAPDDTHGGAFGTDCAECHAVTRWSDVRFDHEFPLTHGARRASECVVCHTGAPETYDTYTCYGCHAHTPANVLREHRGERVANLDDCVRCHSTGREHDRRRGR